MGACIVIARDAGMILLTQRPDLEYRLGGRLLFEHESWVRRLTVTQLAHNLMGILLQYGAASADIEGEYVPVVNSIEEILRSRPEFGLRAVEGMGELFEHFEKSVADGRLPRHGWGEWIMCKLKFEVSRSSGGFSLNPCLDEADLAVAGAIDDYVTRPFVAGFDAFYR